MSGRANIRWVKPPAFLVAIAGLVGIIGIGMTIVGSQTIGVSTDEPGHVRRVNNYMESGLYVRPFELRMTPPGQTPIGAYVYGPVTSLFQHDVQRRIPAVDKAREILGLTSQEAQETMAARVVAEGMSVRAVEEAVQLALADTPEEEKAPRARNRRPVPQGLTELADRLSDRLETRVKVALGRTKGKITVEFASMEDLRRIVDIMDPRNRDDRPI